MSGVVAAVRSKISPSCLTSRCRKEGCSVSMQGASSARVIVDMDSDALDIPQDRRRCDYLFIDEDNDEVWVAPIELKSGAFKGSEVVEQLRTGACVADAWLPPGNAFRFVPVLAHRKGVHPKELRKLRKEKIKLRDQTRQTVSIGCGARLITALKKAVNPR